MASSRGHVEKEKEKEKRKQMFRPIGDLGSSSPSCRQDFTLIVLKDGFLPTLPPDLPP